MTFKIVAISDTHNKHHEITIPECDFLIHAGDFSFHGYAHELTRFARWLHQQPARHKIIIPGNHEFEWEQNWNDGLEIFKDEAPEVHILNDSGIELEGIKFWGSPITPEFHAWAWNRYRGPDIKRHWDLIPDDAEVLITHGPAADILDVVYAVDGTPKGRAGCYDLLGAIKRVKPDLHFCGHLHKSHGQHYENGTSFYNVSICDEMYCATQPITVVEYEKN